DLADLRCVQADPDLQRLCARRPEAEKLFEIPLTIHHLARDRAVDRDTVTGDVSKNAIVGGRRATDVGLRLQAVHGYHDRETTQSTPGGRNLANRAGDELHVDAPPGQ